MGGILTLITSATNPAPNDIIRASWWDILPLTSEGVDTTASLLRLSQTKPTATLATDRNRLPSRRHHETICAEQQTASASGRIGHNYQQDNMLTVNSGWQSAATRDFGVMGETANSQR